MATEWTREPARQPLTDAEKARAKLVQGLQTAAGPRFDALVASMAWAAGQLTGEPNSTAHILGMIEYVRGLQEFGMDQVHDVIGENSGIPVEVTLSEPTALNPELAVNRPTKKPGILVGISGARRVGDQGRPVFDGLAVMHDIHGREGFVAVSLDLRGNAFIDPINFTRMNEKLSGL